MLPVCSGSYTLLINKGRLYCALNLHIAALNILYRKSWFNRLINLENEIFNPQNYHFQPYCRDIKFFRPVQMKF
jgi:hypothetical protein